MLQIAGISVLIVIYFLNKMILRENYKVSNPISICTIVWILVIFVHHFYFEIESYTFTTYALVLTGIVSLAVGFWCFAEKKFLIKNFSPIIIGYNESAFFCLIKFIIANEFLRITYNAYVIIYKLAGSLSLFLSSNTLVRRMYLAYNGGPIANLFEFFTNATAFVGHVLIGIYISKRYKYSKSAFILITICEILFALITMSKMCLIVYVIVVGTSYLNGLANEDSQKKIIKRIIPFLTFGFFAFFMVIGMQRNYMARGGDLKLIILQQIAIYFSGPMEALGKFIENNASDLSMGTHTFGQINRILQRLDIVSDSPIVRHGVDMDIGYDAINVYTWFKNFYQDYSFVGFILVPFLFGLIGGILYNQKDKGVFVETCNAWITAIFAMSFYTFLWSQTVYLFVILYAYLFHRFFGKKIYILST